MFVCVSVSVCVGVCVCVCLCARCMCVPDLQPALVDQVHLGIHADPIILECMCMCAQVGV